MESLLQKSHWFNQATAMGHRLSKIYTRTGDKGLTGLGDGKRVPKYAIRVDAYGTVDELNSQLGVLIALSPPDHVSPLLIQIQHELFDLGSELCVPGYAVIKNEHVEALEKWLDYFNADLPPLKEFILPGGSLSAAHCHVVRSVCRRAERICTELADQETINPYVMAYLNRLSDLLFVVARVLARIDQGQEVLWQANRPSLPLPE